MNKVITINLNGLAFQLEEAGYDALRAYLDGAARRLEGNPDKDEIIADIEHSIAEKCRAVLGTYKTVVETREVGQIIEEMGPVEDASATEESQPRAAGPHAEDAAAGSAHAAAAGPETRPPPPPVRRLYKIREGAMFAGVCAGLAAYFAIDVTIVRVGFALLTVITWGLGILAYLFLMLVLPVADTAAEKAAAYGAPTTAQEFIRRARAGYYEGMKTWGDRHAHRVWRRRFRREMRGWARTFGDEMREGAYRWRQNADWRWTPGPGLWIAWPVLTLLRGILTLIAIFALISLITTGAVFGLALPAGVPVWVACIVLIVVYNIVVWPLKVWRHAWCWRRGPHFAAPLFSLGDTIIWLGCVVFLIWLADRYVPHAHEALQNLPPAIHHAVDTVKQWWATR